MVTYVSECAHGSEKIHVRKVRTWGNPQSEQFDESKTFSGLRSQWTMFFEWRCFNAIKILREEEETKSDFSIVEIYIQGNDPIGIRCEWLNWPFCRRGSYQASFFKFRTSNFALAYWKFIYRLFALSNIMQYYDWKIKRLVKYLQRALTWNIRNFVHRSVNLPLVLDKINSNISPFNFSMTTNIYKRNERCDKLRKRIWQDESNELGQRNSASMKASRSMSHGEVTQLLKDGWSGGLVFYN